MVIIDELRALSRPQRSAFIASLLGWALDAFDFFLFTLVQDDIARGFGVKVSAVSLAIVLTLAARPVGALIFGRLADRYGRRPILMINIGLYSLLAAAFVSGILQEGYPLGYFLAALAFLASPWLGWRGMLALGIAPALLILYVRGRVEESPVWQASRAEAVSAPKIGLFRAMKGYWPRFAYAVVLMTFFNFFSHGTQDLYPLFLKVQHKFGPPLVTTLTVCLNLGAIVGGVFFGWLSERIGRRRAIVLAALFALPMIPLWAYSSTPLLLGLGAFLIQVAVQGAFGVVPTHLNELSPPAARGTFPGFAYQLGNLFAAVNAYLQTRIAEAHHNDYGLALASVCGVVAVGLALVTWFGPEAKGAVFGEPAA
jgi:MFS transporter, SHS family, lactate transporter